MFFFAKFVGMGDMASIGRLIRSGEIRSLQDIFKYVAPAEIAEHLRMPPRLLVRQLQSAVKVTGEQIFSLADLFQVEPGLMYILLGNDLVRVKRFYKRKETVISL